MRIVVKLQQYRMTVDDDEYVSVLHIAKGTSVASRNWQLKLVYTRQMPREKASATKGKSNLRYALLISPITQFQPKNWQAVDGSESARAIRIVISFTRGAAGSACPNLVLSCDSRGEDWVFQGYTRERYSSPNGQLPSRPSVGNEAALAKPMQEFDKQFNMQGHVRVRHWGTAKAPDGRSAAACVTLHPSDMIEHSITSSERCTVVFARLPATEEDIQTDGPHNDPRREILQWLATNTGIDSMTTDMDLKLVQVAAACVYSASRDDAASWNGLELQQY